MTELTIAEAIARKAHAGQVEESTGDDYIRQSVEAPPPHAGELADLASGEKRDSRTGHFSL